MTQQVQEHSGITNGQWENYADLPVGEILRRGREHYNLSLNDVEAALRIRASQLGAIEQGRLDLLPGRVYAVGFVRAYAEYLGLDGGLIVQLFKAQSGESRKSPELHFPVAASESKVPNKFMLAGALASLLLLVGVLSFFAKEPRHEVPPVNAQEKTVATADMSQPFLQASVLAAIETAAGEQGPSALIHPPSRVIINAKDSAWVEIRNSEGKAVLSRILNKGDSYLVPDEEGLVLDTGNIGVLDFVVDGTPIMPLGQVGDVRRDVSLDPEQLLQPVASLPVQ